MTGVCCMTHGLLGACFMGSTPERLYARSGAALAGEAVAGTRPRGPPGDVAADFYLGLDLLQSDKVRLTDLGAAAGGEGGGGGEAHLQTGITRMAATLATAGHSTPVMEMDHAYRVFASSVSKGFRAATGLYR